MRVKITSICLLAVCSFSLLAQDYKENFKNAKDDEEKISILEEIKKSGDAKQSKFLISVLTQGESSKLRSAAASALGSVKQGVDELQKAFDTDDIYVREASIEALAEIGAQKSLAHFEKAYKDKNEKIRDSAIKGLSKTAKLGNASMLREALNSKNKDTQWYALEGIAKIKAHEEWKHVKKFCSDANVDLATACLRVAGQVELNDALAEIEKNLANPNEDISKTAIEALGNYKAEKVIPTLIRFKRDNPNHTAMAEVGKILKKAKAAKQYAIVNVADSLNVRSEANDRSSVATSLKGNAVVEILKREAKKYIVKNAKGEEMENFWYNIKTEDGKKGFIFGEFIQVIESY